MKSDHLFKLVKKSAYWVAFAGLVVVAGACDTLEQTAQSTSLEPADSVPAEAFIQRFQLTDSQAERVSELFDQYESAPLSGSWYIAAGLQETLTAAQKEQLLESVNSRVDNRAQRIGRAGRFGRPGRLERDDFAGLELSESQKEQLRVAREQMRDQMNSLMEQRRAGSLTDEQLKNSVAQIREGMRATLEGALTEEQLARLDEIRNTRRTGRGTRNRGAIRGAARAGRAIDARNDAMIDALGLTAEQREQLKQLREARRAEFESERDALREQIRAGEVEREAMREMLETRREAVSEDLDGILTERQREIIDIHRALVQELRTSDQIEGRRRRVR